MALSYLGTGKPIFTVTDGSTTILVATTLPQPQVNRIVKITNFDLYMNAAGKMVKKYANSNTERWEVTITYKDAMLTQAQFNTILSIIDYERQGYTVNLQARADNANITGTAVLKADPIIEQIDGYVSRGYDIEMTWIIDAVLVGYTQNIPDDVELYGLHWFLDDDYSEVGVTPTDDGSTVYGGISRFYVDDELLTATYNAKTSGAANADELILRETPDLTRAAQLSGTNYYQIQNILSSTYNELQSNILAFDYDDKVNVLVSQPGVTCKAVQCDWQATTETYANVTISINDITPSASLACLSVYEVLNDGVTIYSGYENKFYTYDVTASMTLTLSEIASQSVDYNSITTYPLYFIDKNTAVEFDTVANKIYLVQISDAFVVTARKELEQPSDIASETYWLINADISGTTEPYRASQSSPVVYDSVNKRLRLMALKSTNTVGTPTNDYRNINKIVSWSYKLN